MTWRAAASMLASAGLVGLTGCSSIGGFTGAVAGVATGTATSNPEVGIAVGIGVRAATDDAMNRLYREMQAGEQNEIAATAGTLKPGDRQPWAIRHRLPFSNEHGELEVVSESANALTTCREVLFSVITEKHDLTSQQWFLTQTCKQPDGHWRWAAAEPAIARWGSLQ